MPTFRRRTFRLLSVVLAIMIIPAACGEENAPVPVSRAPSEDTAPATTATPVVLFVGDSLTAGYGLDPELAYPALIQQRIRTLGWSFEVVNAGVSGDTTSSGLRRIDWLLRKPAAVVVIALGANDGLRGITLELTRSNLQAIIDRVRQQRPEAAIVLAGMKLPPNLGQDYTQQFASLFGELAQKNDVPLIPFLLEGVGGDPELNQRDGIHPNARGQEIVAANAWRVLEPVLTQRVR